MYCNKHVLRLIHTELNYITVDTQIMHKSFCDYLTEEEQCDILVDLNVVQFATAREATGMVLHDRCDVQSQSLLTITLNVQPGTASRC